MIRRVWLNKRGEAPVCPVKGASIHDYAADGCTMASNELGGRVNNDISTVLDRLHEIGSGQRIIDNERHTMLMSNVSYGTNIESVQAWVTYGFGIERLSPL